MKKIFFCILRLFTGLFLYAVGIVMIINANLGLAPWEVFHQGLTNIVNITMGQANIAIGLLLIIINSILKEKLGWGTVFNMIFIGIFMDILMLNNLIPVFEVFLPRLMMMLLGMFVIGIASYLYIGSGLGTGPRDGLMVALTKKTNKSVRFVRNSIETGVLIIGYLLGGFIGIGTLITALTVGHFVQFSFKIFNFDVQQVKHRFIDEDIKLLKSKLINKEENYSEKNYKE